MDEIFDEHELLLRAVLPSNRRPDFWKNGRLSSAALKDKQGLSVDRTYDRTINDAVVAMTHRLTGFIVSITIRRPPAGRSYNTFACGILLFP